MSNNPVYSTSLNNVSTQGNSGNLEVSTFGSLLVLINVTALTGTSVTFKVRSVDNFGSLYSLASTSAITGTGTVPALAIVGAAGSPLGDQVVLEWDPVSVTFSAQISVYAR